MINEYDMREEVESFFKSNTKVHIRCINNSYKSKMSFYNGSILKIDGELFIINDRKIGAIPIEFKHLLKIEKFTEKEDLKND